MFAPFADLYNLVVLLELEQTFRHSNIPLPHASQLRTDDRNGTEPLLCFRTSTTTYGVQFGHPKSRESLARSSTCLPTEPNCTAYHIFASLDSSHGFSSAEIFSRATHRLRSPRKDTFSCKSHPSPAKALKDKGQKRPFATQTFRCTPASSYSHSSLHVG